MTDKYRIAVADDESVMRDFYREALARLGHTVVSASATGTSLVEECRKHQPDLVIADIKMPDMDGLEAARQVYDDRPVPVIIVTAHSDPSFIERANDSHASAYLVKPIKEANLAPAIAIAMQRFEEFRSLRKETDGLRQALEDRKLIERAKGILMKQARLDEEHAFRRLQKLASSNNQKLVEAARMIVLSSAAFSPTDE